MIISGEIAATEQIDVSRLIDVLGIGRTPIREALQRLQAEGIVRILPKRGVQVVTLSADDIHEIYQVISAIEVEVVRLITLAHPARKELQPLIIANKQMASSAEQNDREAWIRSDEAFHRALLNISPNARLRAVGLTHRDLAQRAHFVALRLMCQEQTIKSARLHNRLVKLLTSGDDSAAAECHLAQRERGAQMLVGVLRKYGLSQL